MSKIVPTVETCTSRRHPSRARSRLGSEREAVLVLSPAPSVSSHRLVIRSTGASMFKTQQLPLARLLEADWNANRVSPSLLAKIRRSIERFGVVENLVARPHPKLKGSFEVLSGNHRLRIL